MERKDVEFVDLLKDAPGVISAFVIKVREGEAVVIDPGPSNSYERLKEHLERRNLKVKYVIVTHVHIDHAGAAGLLVKDFPVEKVFVHPRGYKHLIDPSKLWSSSKDVLGPVAEYYGKPEPVPQDKVVSVDDGQRIEIGDKMFIFIHTPGHASHHMSIYLLPNKILFSGDSAGVVLDVNGVPTQAPTTPPIFKPKMYINSIEKMKRLEPEPLFLAPTHFGIREGFKKLIQKHEMQIRLWLDVALKSVMEGIDDIYEITKRISEADEDARRLLSSTNDYVKRAFLYNSVLGIVDAVKRKEWP
jgi:glyoxylase-like metal-dependent hydrolase (beta-lactamase superfamily II)